MNPNNPIVKNIVRFLYWIIYIGISFGIFMAFSFCILFLNHNGINLGKAGKAIQILIILGLLAYSSWLAGKSATAFSEDNCFFVEAIILSVKESFIYLTFLPFIGQFFYKQQNSELVENGVKKIDNQTRFDE